MAAAEKLVVRANKLQAPAITALADQMVFRHDVIRFGEELLARTAAVDLQLIPEKAHRGMEQATSFSRTVVAGLARDFQIQTGTKPTIRNRSGVAVGPFIDFVANVLKAMSVEVSVESICRNTLASMEKKQGKKIPNLLSTDCFSTPIFRDTAICGVPEHHHANSHL